MISETIVLNQERNVTLTAYVQDVLGEFGFEKRPAMLVLPGGGYVMCSDREADPVALCYAKAGYQAFILRYTVKNMGGWPYPLRDYEQAMACIAQNAEKWHVLTDKIAVVGFSAGGHLAACAATLSEHKPAAAVLIYPAILKEIVDLCQSGMPYPHEEVTKETCPCFLAAARDDRVVEIRNTLMMELALADQGIPFESHIYSYGGHGFSTAEKWVNQASVSERVPHWVPDSISWLQETLGILTKKGMGDPCLAVSKNGDDAPVLSVACTLNHIRKQGDKVKLIMAPLFAGIEAVAKERDFSLDGLMAAVGNMTIRELMETVEIPQEHIIEIDKQLHGMMNQNTKR